MTTALLIFAAWLLTAMLVGMVIGKVLRDN